MWFPQPFLTALLPTAICAVGNVVDAKLARRMGTHGIVFFEKAAGFVVALGVLAWWSPALPRGWEWPAVAVAGIAETAYVYPYMRALAQSGASTVAALFGLGKVLVPVLAFLMAGEALPAGAYAGFLLIVGSSVALGAARSKDGRWSLGGAFWNMLACSGILALAKVATRDTVGNGGMDWMGFFFWSQAAALAAAAALFAWPAYRRGVAEEWARAATWAGPFSLQAVLSAAGVAASVYALREVPATYASGVASAQPMLVLALSWAGAKIWPRHFYEATGNKDVLRKTALYACMAAGVIVMTATTN